MDPMVLSLVIFLGVFFVFLLSGWMIAFALAAASLLAYIFIAGGTTGNFAILGYNALFTYTLLALPIFILMGTFLIEGGVATILYEGVLPLMERVPGGLIHTNIIGNIILGACSGSTIAATTCMATVCIPELKKRGYDKGICYGSLAAAGNLASLIPPSVGLIIFASLTTVSLGQLFIAGIVPGLFLAVCFGVITAIWVRIHPEVAPSPKEKMPLGSAFFLAIRKLWALLVLIVVVLGVIYLGIGTPTEAGCYGAVGALLLGVKRLDREKIKSALFTGGRVSGSLLFVIAMASVYGFALNALGLREWLLAVLGALPGDQYIQMFLVWLILLVLGMFIDGTSIIVITTPIFLPFAVSLGFDPVWFGVWLMLAANLGNITPPVGITLYAVITVSKDSIDVVARGCLPFWASFFMVMIPMTFFPAIATWLPSLAAFR